MDSRSNLMIDASIILQMRLEHCQRLLDNDEQVNALLEIEEILDEHNECIDALYLAGQTYLLLRDSLSAELCFRKIKKLAFLEEQQAELHLSLALALFFQYRFPESLAELKNALRHNNQTALTWRYQGMVQERLGHSKVARLSAKNAYSIDPENNIIPDWNIEHNISDLNSSLLELTHECGISNILWEAFPQKPSTLSRKSISPQQVVFIDRSRRSCLL